jgi:O-acetyl-ADP-ribose deacetylase (regulator of RNase III)
MPNPGRLRDGAGQADEGLPPPRQIRPPHPGPIWQGGDRGEAAALASCYRSCLTLARDRGIETLDFPSISTGVYGYPIAQAATVALRAIMDFLTENDLPRQVRMVCHTPQAAEIYRQTWNLWYAEEKDDRL